MKKITISDISGQLGLSKTTVSFVLNGKGDEKNISKQSQQRILDLAEELNFRPSILAQSLKKGKTFAIGYLVPDISNPFFARIARKIEDHLLKLGYHLFIASTDENPDKEETQIQSLMARKVDGIIIASSNILSKSIKNMVKQNFPLVLFDRIHENIKANYVLVEDEKPMQQVVEELYNSNCHKIGILSITPQISSLHNRIEGYKKAILAKEGSINQTLIRTVDKDNIKDSTLTEMKALIEAGADAMVFTNNLVAQEAIWHMNVHFKSELNTIKFAAYDNISLYDYSMPRVLALAQPIDDIAVNIVKLIQKQLDDKKASAPEKIILKPKMIKRI